MFKSIFYVLILAIIVNLVQSQALQVGSYARYQEGTCPTPTGGFNITQDHFGYQIINASGRNTMANITVNSDSSFTGSGYLYNLNPPYGFSGFTSVKGIVYNQYMFTATYAKAPGYAGGTFFFQFNSC
ncbi:hypothetical protein ACTFIZ_000449 [Dictyostelium cf. discoideum]